MENFFTSFLVGATGVAFVEGIFKLIEKRIDGKNTSIKDLSNEFKDFKKEVSNTLKELKKRDDSNTEAQRQTLYFLVRDRCKQALSEGEISEEDWKALNDGWVTYHDQLGGNGYLNDMMEKVSRIVKYK